MDPLRPILCWHCSSKFKTFKAAVEHAADSHASQKVKLRLCRLDPVSGTFKYVSKEYNVTPAAVRVEGNQIVAHQDETITVEHKSED